MRAILKDFKLKVPADISIILVIIIYSLHLPKYDNYAVDEVPARPKVGIVMKEEAHGKNLN